MDADPGGVPLDANLRVTDGVWAVGDVTGIWPLTHVGKYQGRVVAANILGTPREANYEAVPRAVYTDPQAASVGASSDTYSATVMLRDVGKTATYTRAYAETNGFLTLLSNGERITGAYALGPEAAEWLQQATLAVRARVPLEILMDTIQPFPTFSEVYLTAVKQLVAQVETRLAESGSRLVRAKAGERGEWSRQRCRRRTRASWHHRAPFRVGTGRAQHFTDR